MPAIRMVPLVTVANGFQARVVAARLGAAGVLAQLGGGVDGPYPIGDVRIDVPEAELDLARQLLLADEVEATFAAPSDEDRGGVRRHGWAPWVVIAGALVAEAVALASRLS